MNSISDLKHIFYINLDSRPDRKIHIEQQMNNIGIKPERFKAIHLSNGSLGCSLSHLKLLEIAKEKNYPHILIVEDDILFTSPLIFINQFNKFLSKHKDFDVVLIAGNNLPPHKIVDNCCIQVKRCQTTTGYLVQNHYYDKLINNYREGISKLMKEPNKHNLYAIDKHWLRLQRLDNWYLIIPLTNIQREDYSDIEKKITNYSRDMLDLDKKIIVKWILNQK